MTEVTLRAPADGDLETYVSLLNDSSLQSQVMGPPRPRSLAQVREWLDQKLSNADFRILTVDNQGKCAGYAQIANIDWINRHGTLGICLAAADRGSGLGTEATRQLHQYARERLNLRKLILTVREDNPAAITIYKKLGYLHIGSFKDHVWAGTQYVDVALMEVQLSTD